MAFTHHDDATTWRDLADALTPAQVGLLESAERRPSTSPAELLEWARECVESNAEQVEIDARLAHIAIPAGATAGGWDSIRVGDGDATRSLEWATFDTAKVHIAIDGFQSEDTTITRGVSVYAKHGDISELSVTDVRELAEALKRAADELERLA